MNQLDFEKEENKRLLLNLYAFSRVLFNKVYSTDVNNKGKSFKDYVYDALEKHLRGEDNFDPNKGTLDYHLKYNIIRQAIINDLPSSIRKEYNESRKKEDKDLEMVHLYQESKPIPDIEEIPCLDQIFDRIDNNLIFTEIEKEINGDNVVEKIYLAIVHDKFDFGDRQEICEEYEISYSDFDNGRRRFLTVLKRVFRNLKIKL